MSETEPRRLIVDDDPVAEELEAEYGDVEETDQPWTIEQGHGEGTDPEEQAGRALWAAKKVAGAKRALQTATAAHEKALEAIQRRLKREKRTFLKASLWARKQVKFWIQTSGLWEQMDRKSMNLADMRVGSRAVTRKARAEIRDPDALFDIEGLPRECFKVVVRKSKLYDHVELVDGQVVVKATGEVVPVDIARATEQEQGENYYIEIDGDRVDLDDDADEKIAEEIDKEERDSNGTTAE